MDCDHFYVTLLSNSSQTMYPQNTLAAFTAHLAKPIDLGSTERWEVGVSEITSPAIQVGTIRAMIVLSNTLSLLYCDLISPQFFGDRLVRVLRTFITPSLTGQYTFTNIHYVPVEKRIFQDIRIEILNTQGGRIAFKDNKTPIQIVLHFRRVTKC